MIKDSSHLNYKYLIILAKNYMLSQINQPFQHQQEKWNVMLDAILQLILIHQQLLFLWKMKVQTTLLLNKKISWLSISSQQSDLYHLENYD